jgi:acetoin utilization deacetylase AcuC-like enzyme
MLKIAWAPNYAHSLPENHRFPMLKYELLPEQLLYEGTVTSANFFTPHPLPAAYVLLTHEASYWQKLSELSLSAAEQRKTGFPLSRELVDREITIMNGTVQAALLAMQWGIAMNVAGGTHHAFTNRGEGFCLLNDNAIAAHYLLRHGLAKKVLILDLDVHQGNGTAQIFRQEPRVFTFSMHGAKNYPLHKEESDLDIALPDGTPDQEYLRILQEELPRLFVRVAPNVVLYQCGVDVLESDKLGRLCLSVAGCRRRDELVLKQCRRDQVPVACSMGGGYSPKISTIVEAHANTFRLAQEIFF